VCTGKCVRSRIGAPSAFSDPATCVLTSGAVWQVLQDFGIPARVIRVKAFVWPIKDRRGGCVLGSNVHRDVSRPKAPPGKWYGHVAVLVFGNILIDATLDQANATHPWLDPTPMAVRFRDPTGFVVPTGRNSGVSYTLYPDLGGFKSAPGFRPSARKQLVDMMKSEIFEKWRGIVEREAKTASRLKAAEAAGCVVA